MNQNPAVRDGVYVTRNSEYHFRGGVCVEVRNRKTGTKCPSHAAIGLTAGAARIFSNGSMVPTMGSPNTGDVLIFDPQVSVDERSRSLVTSKLERVDGLPARMATN